MSQLIRICSDLHLEHLYDTFAGNSVRAIAVLDDLIKPLPTDPETVLIIAGDLGTARRVNRITTFLGLVVPRFKHVIYVFGNHEHYGGDINTTETIVLDALRESTVDMSKLTVAGNEVAAVEIGGVQFYAATLWTDYDKGNLHTANLVSRYITDHKVIQCGQASFSTEMARVIHDKSMVVLGSLLAGKDNSRTVVVTHHLPSYEAVNEEYKFGDPTTRTLNAAFATNLDDFIIEHKPALWAFGHTHIGYLGKVGDTKLVCNPLGYPNESNDRSGRFDKTTVYVV
jgi:predicted MPP superfamily phosphohydrolase